MIVDYPVKVSMVTRFLFFDKDAEVEHYKIEKNNSTMHYECRTFINYDRKLDYYFTVFFSYKGIETDITMAMYT